MRKRIFLVITVAMLIVSLTCISRAGDESLWTISVEPDVLIVLDLSGSMAWLPQGNNPTLYGCGSCVQPYYKAPHYSGVPLKLYVAGNNCNIDGPFTVNAPGATPDMPTSNLWVAGNNCGVDGPFYPTKPDSPNLGTYVYISTSQSCGIDGPYYPSSGSGHTKQCNVSGEKYWWGWWIYQPLPDPLYKENTGNCTTGPFYKTSGIGHNTTCGTYKSCSALESGYTETDCATGPFYKSDGPGHRTACGSGGSASKQCNSPSPAYTETDCATGPFYKSDGPGHRTICQDCTKSCTPGSNFTWSDTDSCDGPYYKASGSGRTDCSRLAIAKRSLFKLMDADGSGTITSADNTSLGIRLGLMRFYDCGSEDNDNTADPWVRGKNQLSWSMTQSDNKTATPYVSLYCDDSTCVPTVSSCKNGNDCVAGFQAKGGTPLAYSLKEAKAFLAHHKTIDDASTCRQKSIILITDGEDTYACGGGGGSAGVSQRRAPIYRAKQAADSNFKVYVVGFGSDMPTDLQDTLNWAAYYGKTRNPNDTQIGDTSAVTVGNDPCSNGTDPKGETLRGYAFMASNPDELVSALQTALASILEATYSFSTQASVAAARVQEENYIYEASFEPKNNSGVLKEPFWTGHLRKYQIGDTGQLITPHCWDAGELLKLKDPANRNMFTLKGGTVTSFDTWNITAADLAVADDAARNLVVGFYRGESAFNKENWKLGDLFHTNPITVKTPNQFFFDPRDQTSPIAFSTFRDNHQRYASNGKQLIIVGGNDGQLHAFRSGNGADCTSGGEEMWSFIPPNLLQKISPIAHNSHLDRASLSAHDFFVDGPLQVADVWIPSTDSDGKAKSENDWKTILMFGLGQGSGAYLWSNSSNCYSSSTSAFSGEYHADYSNYCGFYAMNVTDSVSTTPTYMWHLSPTSSQAPYLGQAWSKMQTGRVKIGDNEKWVGFIGGGYSSAICSGACNTPATGSAGKGFFVVDLKDGSILWSYTHADNANMNFSLPAAPLPVDLDGDQFIDTVYIGDLGGNMWRFRLCPKNADASCGTGNWTGSRVFASTPAERGSGNTHKQIFTVARATYDDNNNLWIFFGTGENNDPVYRPTTADPDTATTKNRLYAIKEDPNFTVTYTAAKMDNITISTYTDSDAYDGWYINLSTGTLTRPDSTTITNPTGEKMISDPAIFGGWVYFTTYVPEQSEEENACGASGDAFLYSLNYLTGAGRGADGSEPSYDNRTSYIGHGIGSSVLVSYGPHYADADIYATASGGAGTGSLTQSLGKAPKGASMTSVLYWKDKRLE